ncbi:hypothetical protein [Rufibacter quisquiliarum]|uniref:Lipoprotein n=1 Tax=Rufibacter quisquiliarum TaxID=1549639 RepID=A0A839GZL4_9BACT|nr:hypothetical protein [Rufibacter quisquiliarum]MBA9079878.1 hypothetical protein [Rufibacter quisquiliarum]
MKKIIFALLVLVAASCGRSDNDKSTLSVEANTGDIDSKNTSKTNTELFREFLKKFSPIGLPYVFRETSETSADYNGLQKLDKNSIDTLFANAEFFDETYCLGMLSDTSNYYALVFLQPASEHYPVLATYTKEGKLIGQEDLINGACGSDCGLVECTMTGIIKKDFSILSVDSIRYEYSCDTLGNPIPNSGELIVIRKSGKVQGNGEILMGKEKRTETKTNP